MIFHTRFTCSQGEACEASSSLIARSSAGYAGIPCLHTKRLKVPEPRGVSRTTQIQHSAENSPDGPEGCR